MLVELWGVTFDAIAVAAAVEEITCFSLFSREPLLAEGRCDAPATAYTDEGARHLAFFEALRLGDEGLLKGCDNDSDSKARDEDAVTPFESEAEGVGVLMFRQAE